MENLGYKEGIVKPRKVGRQVSIVPPEEIPLSNAHGIKTIAPGLWIRRKSLVANINVSDGQLENETDKEYMICGPSPPAETARMYDSYEETITDLCSQINRETYEETIRTNLIEQLKYGTGITNYLDEIERENIIPANVKEKFENSTQNEKNYSFLWCAFLKRWDLLEHLLDLGANLNYCDNQGLSALHLAAFSGCLASTNFLIERGMDVNYQPKTYAPLHLAAFADSAEVAKLLITFGASIKVMSNKINCKESLLHCAVRADAKECLKVFTSEGVDVNELTENGTNAIHLAADLGHNECLKVLLDTPGANPNIRICVREKESTALHLAADEGNLEAINLLLAHGADARLQNHRGFTALHLASRTSSLECVEALLKFGNADPNSEDFDNRTPLHAAIGKSENAVDIIEMLVAWGADINHKDIFGLTAIHLAALDGLTHCVDLLIYHTADVTIKSKKGITPLSIITRKTPSSLDIINKRFDSAIRLQHSEARPNLEAELEFNFCELLQFTHPREIAYLNSFVDDGQKEFLEHPLCSAFLYIKWQKIKKYFIAKLMFSFTFTVFLTLYTLTALATTCSNRIKIKDNYTAEELARQELCQKQSLLGNMLRNNPFVIETQWYLLVIIAIIEIIRKLIAITGYTSMKRYATQVENYMEWFVIVSVFAISYLFRTDDYLESSRWQNHVGAFAVLLCWTNLMFMVGQLPVIGAYVAMYTKVQGEFAKLFMAYLCILIGFTISFCVIFPSNAKFSNPFMGFITVLVLMTGELDLSLLVNDPNGEDPPLMLEVSAQIVFVLFLLFVTVTLMNLLVGIAVDDIQGLKKTAGLSKLVRQTKLISYIESAFFNTRLPKWLKVKLLYSALVSPQTYRVILSVKPLNPGEKRLPYDILQAAYNIAKHQKQRETKHTKIPDVVEPDDSINSDTKPEPDNIFSLLAKINESSDRISTLSNEIKSLQTSLQHDYDIMDNILASLPNEY